MVSSPSFKDFALTDFLLQIITWRHNLPKFFEDITGLKPRPFQEEFFREVQELKTKNIVIVAGRGIGKTLALATVALWYVLVLAIAENRPFKVVILAGSLKQAKICFNYIMDVINHTPFLQRHLAKEPTQEEILFKDGSWIRPLPASEKSIRGHHPDLLIIDEAAEVEDSIIYAALPMTAPSPYARHIFSTTPSLTGSSWIEDKWDHQHEPQYAPPQWKFFNWNAESILPPDQVELLKHMLPADAYATEIQGLPYRREGKVFRLEDLKECTKIDPKEIEKEEIGEVYAGIDWGYYPAPTVLVIVKRVEDKWRVLYSEAFLAENFEEMHRKIKLICESYNVVNIFTDSTDKGENLRLAAEGLPVTPVSFKAEKPIMISNLRMLIERHKLKIDPMTQQRLIDQLMNYTYDSKRNDDFVDALMLAVRANPIASHAPFDLEAFLSELVVKKRSTHSEEDRKSQIGKILKEMGRM
ncbi:MAG: terminase family protein [Candidatus Parvarchaeota archaeon]|nr:terminase family protein [Candidatus Haiyanarchaeum thermophilum]